MMMQAVATIGCGIIIGFIFSWKFTLFILGAVPIMLVCGAMQIKIAKGFSGKNSKDLETAGKVSIFTSRHRPMLCCVHCETKQNNYPVFKSEKNCWAEHKYV